MTVETHLPPAQGDTWVALSEVPLDAGPAVAWAITPECGAVVLFAGTVRDHAEGRPGVHELTYEAYEEQAATRMHAVATGARRRFPVVGRLALVHRVGTLAPGDVAVLVIATAPHRPEAFSAARWCIDTVKATVPIWKHERWDGGEEWGLCAHPIGDVEAPAGDDPGAEPVAS